MRIGYLLVILVSSLFDIDLSSLAVPIIITSVINKDLLCSVWEKSHIGVFVIFELGPDSESL